MVNYGIKNVVASTQNSIFQTRTKCANNHIAFFLFYHLLFLSQRWHAFEMKQVSRAFKELQASVQ